MKKMNLVILLFFLIVPIVVLANPQTKQLSADQFERQLSKAYEVKDSTRIVQLIKNYRYHVASYINMILNKSIRERLAEKKEAATAKIDQAEQAAKIINKIFSSDFLVNQVKLYQEWTTKQCKTKIKADSLARTGTENAKKGQLDKALQLWQQALEIFRQLRDEYAIAKNLYDTGKAYRHIGNQSKASEILEIAVKKAQRTEDEKLEGDALRELGVVSYLKGNPNGALMFWQKALAVFQEANAKKQQGVTLSHIGIYYKNKGESQKAIQYYEKAIAIAEETNDKSEKANTLINIGNIYLDLLADYDKAKKYFKDGLKIKQEIGRSLFDAAIIGNIGICYKNQGDYFQALKYFIDAVNKAEKINNAPVKCKNLSDIGTIYTELGDYERALPYYEKALSIRVKIGDHKSMVETLMNLGVNYGRSDNFHKADSIYKEALKKAKKVKLISFEEDILANLGSLNVKRNNYKTALEYYDAANKICDKISDIRQKNKLFLNYGELYYNQRKYPEALKEFTNAKNLSLKIKASDFIWQAFYGKGKTLEKLGDPEKAFADYDSAISYIEIMRSKLKAKSLRESFMNEKISVYKAMIYLLLKQGQDKKAYEYLQRSKARSLLEIISNSRNRITQGISPEFLKRKKSLELKISKLQQELVLIYASTNVQKNESETATIEDSLQQARHNFRELLQEIELKYPKYANLTSVTKPLNLEQIQKKIVKPGSILLDYLVGENQTIVWVIGNELFKYQIINIKKEELEKIVLELLQPFRDVKKGKIKNYADISFDLKLAQKLYHIIFYPIESYINKENHIIIVPDDILFYLPFEMLVTSIEKKKHDRNILFSRYLNASYLMEKYSISFTQSASILDPDIFSSQRFQKQENKLIAFGNPDFRKADEHNRGDDSNSIFDILTRSSAGIMFSKLPKSEEEVIAISKIMKPSKIYLEKEAKEEYFKNQAGNSPFIHLATHCIVDESQPMFSRIVFSQDDDVNEDGFLHTYEVFNLRLNADLITLSACETGLGKLSRGEGLIGLTRAFMYAGAPSVVVSLWSVDESTSEIMKYFYKNLNTGKGKAEALRLAKLRLIRNTGKFNNGQKFSYANPFLWGPFVLFGDWE